MKPWVSPDATLWTTAVVDALSQNLRGKKGILNELQQQVEAEEASRGHEVSDLVNKDFVFFSSVDELTVLDGWIE